MATVALAALEQHGEAPPTYTLASHLLDEPLSIDTPEGPWQPSNYEAKFRGSVTLRRAVEESINVPIARLGYELGPARIVETAHRMGFESSLKAVPSLALGASEVAPLEVAQAYALLARGGTPVKAQSILYLGDSGGEVLGASDATRATAPVEREFDAAEVALVTSVLRGAVERGTGRGLRRIGYRGPVAGKTGTTNGTRDAWFVAYTPELVVVAWVGFDDGRELGLTGAGAALPMVGAFLLRALGEQGGRDFVLPPGLESVSVHEASGLRSSFLCWGRRELFLVGTAPQGSCGPSWSDRTPPRRRPKPGRRQRRHERSSVDRFFDALLDAID